MAAYRTHMDYQRFYKQLFQPIEERIGPVDETTIMAIIGFDCGGPVSLCTVGRGRKPFVTYITCELAVRDEQQPAEFGRYEVTMTCEAPASNQIRLVQHSKKSSSTPALAVDSLPPQPPTIRRTGLSPTNGP